MGVQRVRIQVLLAVLTVAGMTACSQAPGGTAPAPTSTAGSTESTTGASDAPPADTETTRPAPSPSAPPAAQAGPGKGNAELAIMVKPSEAEAAVNYTLVCQAGVPSAESQHPSAEAACAALKNNAALLSPPTRNTAQACTQQYGGPQQATVTGIVDETPVDVAFALTDGCEISAWNAAEAILGSSGGAA